jgi:hypothetical protein
VSLWKGNFLYRDVKSGSGQYLLDYAEWQATGMTITIEEVASPISITSELRSEMDRPATARGPSCAANGSVFDSALMSHDNPNSKKDDISCSPADDSFFDTRISSHSDNGGSGIRKDDVLAPAEYVAGFVEFQTTFVCAQCMLNLHKYRML